MIDGSILDRQNLYRLIDLMAADLSAGHSWGDSGSNDAMKFHDRFEEARFDETAKGRDPQTDALRDQFAMDATGRLIAAAPDMLIALENLENDDGQIPPAVWKLVKDAIAKAHGETNS